IWAGHPVLVYAGQRVRRLQPAELRGANDRRGRGGASSQLSGHRAELSGAKGSGIEKSDGAGGGEFWWAESDPGRGAVREGARIHRVRVLPVERRDVFEPAKSLGSVLPQRR